MSLSAGSVSLGVTPDTTGFGANLKSGLLGHTKGVGENMGGMILGGLKMMAGPIMAVGAAMSVKHILQDSMHAFEDLAGSVRGVQRITGGTVEQASSLQASMQLSGVATEKASTALKIFSKNLGNASGDTKKTADMQKLLGTSFLDAAGNMKPMAEIMPGLADKFKAMPDGAEKTALAMKLFGRQGADMIPYLNKGSAGIQEMTDKAKSMGLVLDDTAMKTFVDAKKSARMFDGAIQGLKVSLGQDLLPVVDSVQNVFRDALTPIITRTSGFLNEHRETFLKVGEAIKTFGDGAMAGLKPFFSSIGGAFKQLAPVFESLIPQVMTLMSAFSPIGLIFKAIQPVLPGIITAFVNLAVAVGGALGGALGQILPTITQVVGLLVNTLSGVFVQLMPAIVTLANSLGTFLGQAIQMLAPFVVVLVNAFMSLIPPLMPLITQILDLAINAVIPLVQAIFPLVLAILPPLISLFTFLVPIIADVAKVLVGILVPVIGVAIGIIKWLVQAVTGVITWFTNLITWVGKIGTAFGKVFGAIGGVVKSAFDGVVGIVKGAINFIIDMVNGVIGNIDGIADKVKDATGGVINLHVNKIPHLAEGGIVPATPGGRLVRVAEAGQAEAVIPLSKLDDMGNGSGRTINYYAAPNQSIDSEQALFAAMKRAKVVASW